MAVAAWEPSHMYGTTAMQIVSSLSEFSLGFLRRYGRIGPGSIALWSTVFGHSVGIMGMVLVLLSG